MLDSDSHSCSNAIGHLSTAVAGRCPKHISPSNPRVTHSGGEWGPPDRAVPLDQKIFVSAHYRDSDETYLLYLPLGYRAGWLNRGKASDFDPDAVQKGASFAFWMPSMRHPEMPIGVTAAGGASTYRCEQGRPPPGPDEYLVTIKTGHTLHINYTS